MCSGSLRPSKLLRGSGDLLRVARRGHPRATAAGRPHSAGSRGCGDGTRSAKPPRHDELSRFTPSAPRRSCARAASRWAASAARARSSAGCRGRHGSGARGITSAWPRVAGLMSMNASARSSMRSPSRAARRRRSCRRGSRDRDSSHRSLVVHARVARPGEGLRRWSAHPPRTASSIGPRAARRVVGRARSPARARARRRARAAAGAPSRRQRSASPIIGRASSRWRAIASSALAPRVASRSATDSSVTSASTGSHAPQVGVTPSCVRAAALVDEEAEAQVVAHERSDVARETLTRRAAGRRIDIAHLRAQLVVAGEGDRARPADAPSASAAWRRHAAARPTAAPSLG